MKTRCFPPQTTSRFVFATSLLLVAPLHAQIIADGATNPLSNVTTNITGAVIIGTNGSFTLLAPFDNAITIHNL